MPTPANLLGLGRALAHGRRVALTSAVSNGAGVSLLIVMVASGIGQIAQRWAVVFAAVKLAGAAYLVYLGVRTFRARGEPLASSLDRVWGAVASTARAWFARSPRQLSALNGAGGLMMVVMGLGLSVSGRRDWPEREGARIRPGDHGTGSETGPCRIFGRVSGNTELGSVRMPSHEVAVGVEPGSADRLLVRPPGAPAGAPALRPGPTAHTTGTRPGPIDRAPELP